MGSSPDKRRGKGGKKVRVPFRRNRSVRHRSTDWTKKALDAEGHELDTEKRESVMAKGELSRQRTIKDDADALSEDLPRGVVVAMRGLFADVDDGERIWSCTIRRVLRTRLIEERHPVTVGDRVCFRIEADQKGVEREGVIETVEPRRAELRRRTGRRIHTIVANVDQVIIVSAADQPPLRPHLIDRYIVSSLAGRMTPVICLNKVDLDANGAARSILKRYGDLGYRAISTSVTAGSGIDEMRDVLAGKESVMAGQSGVGKSSLLNAVQPGLQLKVGDINEQLSRGRHTTTTATLIRLKMGGYVVDTPGVRSFDLTVIDRGEFEAYFEEFIEHVKHCKYPDCTHIHEDGCAVQDAVNRGDIFRERYDSYVKMFEEPGLGSR